MSTSPGPVESKEDAPPPESKGPPSGRKFPCKQCGARLDFDPSARGLKCPYCGFLEKIEPSADNVQERDFNEYFDKLAGKGTTIAGRSSQVTCTGCGAVVLLEDKITTDKCPYCLTHLENKPVTAEAMIAPEGVLPFKVDHRQAIAAFNDWLAGRWFAPTGLRQLANLGRLSGLYTPYWTYDSMTYTFYKGQRGDDYTVTESYTETDAQGQTVTKTRQVTHTNWTSVSGEVSHFFDDVLVCGSKSLPENFVRELEPWDLEQLVDFRAEYLSGFQTERYAVDLGAGFNKAKQIMDGEVRRLCCRDIGGNHQRLERVSTQHVGVTFKHILMPVWLAAYRYHDQPYQILINARTGEVVGSRPYSFWKIFVMAIIGLIALIMLLFAGGRAFGVEHRSAVGTEWSVPFSTRDYHESPHLGGTGGRIGHWTDVAVHRWPAASAGTERGEEGAVGVQGRVRRTHWGPKSGTRRCHQRSGCTAGSGRMGLRRRGLPGAKPERHMGNPAVQTAETMKGRFAST